MKDAHLALLVRHLEIGKPQGNRQVKGETAVGSLWQVTTFIKILEEKEYLSKLRYLLSTLAVNMNK